MDCSPSAVRALLTTRYLPAKDRIKYALPDSCVLHDNSHANPIFQQGERFLQVLWNERCWGRPLRLRDGRKLDVRSPGTWNPAAGPDFTGATLVVDGALRHGAVEVHCREGDWFGHGHHKDAAYRAVCLHVVGQSSRRSACTDDGRQPPCLILADCVAEELRGPTLSALENYPYSRQVPPGACALRWMDLSDSQIQAFLAAAGLSRFREKARRLLSAIEEKGAEQAVYEGLMDGLGYRSNRTAFAELARKAPLERLRRRADAFECAAALFGTAGFLPDPSTPRRCRGRQPVVRQLWDRWWHEGVPVVEAAWSRRGVRPANWPERRLAAGVLLLEDMRFAPAATLRRLGQTCENPRVLLRALETAFRRPASRAVDWMEALEMPSTACSLGKRRVQDMVVNLVLPYLAAEGARTEDGNLLKLTEGAFLAAPRCQSNRALQETAHRLVFPPSRTRQVLTRACHQQGLLGIRRDFCLPLGTDCLRCPLAKQSSEKYIERL